MCECIFGITTTDGEVVRWAQGNEQSKCRMFQTQCASVRGGAHFWSRSSRSIATQSRSMLPIDFDSTLPMETHENAAFGQFDW